MNAINNVDDVVRYIDERLEYLAEIKRELTKDVKVGETVKDPEYHLRVGMSNELIIIREMLKQIQPGAPLDFVEKAFQVVKAGQLEHMQATYKSDGVVVIVRNPTAEELRI